MQKRPSIHDKETWYIGKRDLSAQSAWLQSCRLALVSLRTANERIQQDLLILAHSLRTWYPGLYLNPEP